MRSLLRQLLRSIVEDSLHGLTDTRDELPCFCITSCMTYIHVVLQFGALSCHHTEHLDQRREIYECKISKVREDKIRNLQVSVKPITAGLSLVFVADMMATQNIRMAPQKSSRIASHR